MPSPIPSPLDVLYVEDDPSWVVLLEEAFAEQPNPARVHTANSASEAVAFLAREGEHADAPRPDLVLLDLDLGGSSGLDVLAALERRDAHPDAPVVVFSGSTDPRNVATAYDRGANAFVSKPLDFERLETFVNGAVEFWTASPPVAETAH